jgi:hypothetical protein
MGGAAVLGMIPTKRERCARFCWAYITRYGPLSAAQIPLGTYTRTEIDRALDDLEAGGQIAWSTAGYSAAVPFVLVEAWV